MNIQVNPGAVGKSWSSRVEIVKSKCGIETWLFEDHSLPIAMISFAFSGGPALDPKGLEGATKYMGALLTQGAGSLTSEAFQDALGDYAIYTSFGVTNDALIGTIGVLSEHLPRAVELMSLALTDPTFESAEIERSRQRQISQLNMLENQPGYIGRRLFDQLAYADSYYSRPVSGTLASIGAITRENLQDMHRQLIVQNNVKVTIVGDVSAQMAAEMTDTLFGALPQGTVSSFAPSQMQNIGKEEFAPTNAPLSVVYFGRPAIAIDDPDFSASMLVNYCFGGGEMTSRLFTEIREKRGLCYAINTGLETSKTKAAWIGVTMTPKEQRTLTVDLIRQEFAKLGENGLSAQELEAAKKFIIGSNGMAFDTSNSIADLLMGLQLQDKAPSWLETRNQLLAAVTLEDANRTAKRLVGDGELVISVAEHMNIFQKARRAISR